MELLFLSLEELTNDINTNERWNSNMLYRKLKPTPYRTYIELCEKIIILAKDTKLKKKIVLLSGSKQKNLKLIKFAKKFKIKIFFGNESNVLERYNNAIKYFKIDDKGFIMRLTADNYLIQPNILNKLSEYKKNYEYISFDPLSHYSGELFSVESFTKKIIKKICPDLQNNTLLGILEDKKI